jgi:hypothetical protein
MVVKCFLLCAVEVKIHTNLMGEANLNPFIIASDILIMELLLPSYSSLKGIPVIVETGFL